MLGEQIIDELKRDIASFADPGTAVEVSDRSVSWTRSRRLQTANLIRRADGFPDVAFLGRELSYQSFLAAEGMADLRDLAESIIKQIQTPPNFIQAPARDNEADSKPLAASELIRKQTVLPGALPLTLTQVLFLYGNAGTGKTSVLTYLTRQQAERYQRGETDTLFLYLDAQGKGLSQLEDVMARALQDLRAKFTYHSVAALTRRHCVIPIVDGFDELIGPSSAREAFANLAQFLGQLEGEGALIASSRSAFMDVTTLFERAAEVAASQSLLYHIQPIEVLPWGEAEIAQFTEGRGLTPASKDRVNGLLVSRAGDLLRKPFYLSRVCDILEQDGYVNEGEDLTRQVTDDALTRESTKLKDQRGTPLLTKEQHRSFCEMLADEMWAQGTPELDCDTIRVLAELFAERVGVGGRERKMLIDRSIAHGLLVPVGGEADKRAFEHELLRFEFQAGSLAKSLAEGTGDFRDYLQRAELPIDVTLRVASFRRWDGREIKSLVDRISELALSSSKSHYAGANGGALAAALIRNRDDLAPQIRLSGLYIQSFDLGSSKLSSASVSKCVFDRVIFSRASLEDSRVADCHFIACVCTKDTSFKNTEVDIADFTGLRIEGQETYDPQLIFAFLQRCGAVVAGAARPQEIVQSQEVQGRIEVAERMLFHAMTNYYLVRSDPWYRKNLEGRKEWEHVEAALRKHRLLEDARLPKKGRPEPFLHLTVPAEKILQARSMSKGTLPAASRFWEDVAEQR